MFPCLLPLRCPHRSLLRCRWSRIAGMDIETFDQVTVDMVRQFTENALYVASVQGKAAEVSDGPSRALVAQSPRCDPYAAVFLLSWPPQVLLYWAMLIAGWCTPRPASLRPGAVLVGHHVRARAVADRGGQHGPGCVCGGVQVQVLPHRGACASPPPPPIHSPNVGLCLCHCIVLAHRCVRFFPYLAPFSELTGAQDVLEFETREEG